MLSFSVNGSIHVVMEGSTDFAKNVQPFVTEYDNEDLWIYTFDNGSSEGYESVNEQLASLQKNLEPARFGANIVFRSNSMLTLQYLLTISLDSQYSVYLVQRSEDGWGSERFEVKVPNNVLSRILVKLNDGSTT